MQLIAVLGIVAMVGLGVFLIMDDKTPATTIVPSLLMTETGVVTTTATVSCPSDGTTSGQIRYEDSLATTNTYLAPTCYFMPMTPGEERVTANTLQTGGTYSAAADLKCTESGTKWRVVCVSSQNDAQSVDEGVDFTAEGAFAKRDVIGKQYGNLKFRVEDKVTGTGKFFNITTCGSETAGTYNTFNGSSCVVAVGDDTGTSLALAADEFIEANIYVKTNGTKEQYGEDDLRTWFLVDATQASWSEPIVQRDGGETLVDAIASMSAEDRRKYSGVEFAYEIGPIGDRESVINLYLATAAGVDPGAGNDPVFEFCSEGRYNSNKDKDTVSIGCWSDAATQVQVTTTLRHYFSINVT